MAMERVLRPERGRRLTAICVYGAIGALLLLFQAIFQPEAAGQYGTSRSSPGLNSARHYLYPVSPAPGMVGQMQLQRRLPRTGYFQPVQVWGPSGAMISLAAQGQFDPPQPSVKAGMLIGQVYRLRVTNIPEQEGRELYPSIEVIDRLHPPPGHEARFPIPIRLSQEELELALRGNFVQRVIYLEHPDKAVPIAEVKSDDQRFVDAGSGQDPLRVADRFGRPMAILRIGSRVPLDANTGELMFGTPALISYPVAVPKPPAGGPPQGNKQTRRGAGAQGAAVGSVEDAIQRTPAVRRTFNRYPPAVSADRPRTVDQRSGQPLRVKRR